MSKIENMNYKHEIRELKDKLRKREREKAELGSGAFGWGILFGPVLVYKIVKKTNQGTKLDMEIRDLRERIQELEREEGKEKS